MADVSTGTSNISSAFEGNFQDLTQPTTGTPSLRDLMGEDTTVRSTGDGIEKTSFLKPIDNEAVAIDMTKQGNVYYDNAGNVIGAQTVAPPPESTSMFDKAGDYLFRGGKSKADVIAAQDVAQQTYLTKMKKLGVSPTEAGIKAARADAGPGFLTTYGPSLGIAGLGLTAAGAFDEPEQERLDVPRSGLDVYGENPDLYNVGSLTQSTGQGTYAVPTSYGFQYNPYAFSKTPFQQAADGGEIFPRRTGGIAPNEGTPGRDSVRAMLMPGEFVMTTDAVKGLGNGNLNAGINNMYNVMRTLENKGRAMA
jgi:hypothetical protein